MYETIRQAVRKVPFYSALRRTSTSLSALAIKLNHTKAGDYRYAIDAFPSSSARKIERVAGWYIANRGETHRLEVRVNGEGIAELLKSPRHDLARAFPEIPQAVRGGFVGDIVIPDDIKDGERMTLSLHAVSDTGCLTLIERDVTFHAMDSSELKIRRKVWGNIFLDPATGRPFSFGRFDFPSSCPYPVIAGVPHFLPMSALPLIRLSATGTTHPYSDAARAMISECSGLVLDFGAGIQAPDRLRDNVLNMDAIQFPYVDVVNRFRTFPFQSNVFDAVISQAVFEHVPDPFGTAKEIYRVLRPGGRVLIDTAFMQPFHGDPDHYFNMTQAGLREVMQGFEIQEIGVRPYQNPSYGLRMQIEISLPFLRSRKWSKTFKRLHEQLKQDGDSLDEALGLVGREILAAGVYVLARKPQATL